MTMNELLDRFAGRIAALLLMTWTIVSPAQPAQSDLTESPVGRWVAEHPSKGGIGSWWEFRSDGSLTMTYGAMVTVPIHRSGDTIKMPSGTLDGAPSEIHFRVDRNTLDLIEHGAKLKYVRVGAPPPGPDLLIGTWKPAPVAITSGEPSKAALEKARAGALYVFTADGSESVRMPFGAREGTWNENAHTFQFFNDAVVYSFEMRDLKLVLAEPPHGKTTDTYLRDPLP